MIANDIGQRSLDWYRARLGNITGSRCGDLMKAGRGKGEAFGETAKAYMLQLAAERGMNPDVVADDEIFSQYVELCDASSKAMRFGTEQEDNAKRLFERLAGVAVEEVSSCRHDTLEHFAASPDGLVYCDLRPVACVEVKCPKQEAFMRYATQIADAATLKAVKPDYYWQTMAEMECTGTSLCYFVAYSPWQRAPLHVAEIRKDEADAALLRERVAMANEYIRKLMDDGLRRRTIVSGVRDTVRREASRLALGLAER